MKRPLLIALGFFGLGLFTCAEEPSKTLIRPDAQAALLDYNKTIRELKEVHRTEARKLDQGYVLHAREAAKRYLSVLSAARDKATKEVNLVEANKLQETIDRFQGMAIEPPDKNPKNATVDAIRKDLERVVSENKRLRKEFASQVTPTDPFLIGIQNVAPGFSITNSREYASDGVAIIREMRGKKCVLQTHPKDEGTPCVLSRQFKVPSKRKVSLVLAVTHREFGDWRLVVKANNDVLVDSIVSKDTVTNGWLEFSIDLSSYDDQEIHLQLLNMANDWNNEAGYWSSIRILTE